MQTSYLTLYNSPLDVLYFASVHGKSVRVHIKQLPSTEKKFVVDQT